MPDFAKLWSDLPALLVAVGAAYAVATYGPALWTRKAAVLPSLPSLRPGGRPSISEAYAALETLKAWGEGRGESYARGVTLIENNWLASKEGDGEPG